jgi:hypothetical protein
MAYSVRVSLARHAVGIATYSYGKEDNLEGYATLDLDRSLIYPSDESGAPSGDTRFSVADMSLVPSASGEEPGRRFLEAAVGIAKAWDGSTAPPAAAHRFFG